jgi:hypothetical protein
MELMTMNSEELLHEYKQLDYLRAKLAVVDEHDYDMKEYLISEIMLCEQRIKHHHISVKGDSYEL